MNLFGDQCRDLARQSKYYSILHLVFASSLHCKCCFRDELKPVYVVPLSTGLAGLSPNPREHIDGEGRVLGLAEEGGSMCKKRRKGRSRRRRKWVKVRESTLL